MDSYFKDVILQSTGATGILSEKVIQNLWSGYGKIIRFSLEGSNIKSVVVKHVRLPEGTKHPRGWNTDLSHQRKIESYRVEVAWYKKYSCLCDESCRIPRCLALKAKGDEVLIVLEDLDEVGFPVQKSSVSIQEIKQCLSWLANFHAVFLKQSPDNLWKIGTYWHLATRPDELDVLDDMELKNAASAIDVALNESKFQTFVHGDAKLANFCFSKTGKDVAAVDFQYVGGGCGMKDVAYFIGSCLYEEDCEKYEKELLESYFLELNMAVKKHKKNINFSELEASWRMLYPLAWTDFHRFIKGWSPGHWKINSYSERIAREVISKLN